jgi:hypothetical protein
MGPTIRLAATGAELESILGLARKIDGFEDASEPSALDSSRVLNAGLNPEDVKTALEIATLAFKTGAALFVFLKALRDYLKARSVTVGVSDPVRGKPLGRIDSSTTDGDINRMLPP